MNYYLIIIAIVIAIGLWNLMIAVLGLFPQCLCTAVGTLSKANTKKNIRTRHGHRIPTLTRYKYIYKVNGKEYHYSSEEIYSKRRLMPKIPLVFVKWFPRRAYPNEFKGTNEWIIGLCMFSMGIIVWVITTL